MEIVRNAVSQQFPPGVDQIVIRYVNPYIYKLYDFAMTNLNRIEFYDGADGFVVYTRDKVNHGRWNYHLLDERDIDEDEFKSNQCLFTHLLDDKFLRNVIKQRLLDARNVPGDAPRA